MIRILSDVIYTGTMVQGKQSTPHFKLKETETKPSSEWVRVEGTHEAIISKANFDLVQRLKRLDTRTTPRSDKVYLFSGMLICGCCGSRMTRKTNHYKDKEYIYYFCPSGKKGGCSSTSMIKESDLTECARTSLKAHINSIVSLNSVINGISRERINKELVNEYTSYIKSNEEQLVRVENFKRSLYENLVSGAISKDEYLQYKQGYTQKAEEIKAAVQGRNEKLEEVLENRSDRNRWINHFLQFSEMKDIDREIVTRLIKSIVINSDKSVDIRFNYQDEYQKAVIFIERVSEEREAV